MSYVFRLLGVIFFLSPVFCDDVREFDIDSLPPDLFLSLSIYTYMHVNTPAYLLYP
jgi:hypothetical protein